MKKIKAVTCNHLYNPIGIDSENIYFSWQIDSDRKNIYQKNYSIIVWDVDDAEIWNSGIVNSEDCLYIAYEGVELKEKSAYRYQITITDNQDEVLVSERQFFETGLTKAGWKGKWIGRQIPDDKESGPDKEADLGQILVDMMQGKQVSFQPDRKLEQCNRFIRQFSVSKEKKIQKARVYLTSYGIYELKINGEKPDDRLFAPGFTKYEKYLEYQTYDITKMLYGGENIVQVTLADGWYKGKFGMLGLGENYGDELAFLMDLEITYEDGTKAQVATDDRFCYCKSPWIYSDILIGAKYDARLEKGQSEWKHARIVAFPYDNLKASGAEPVRPVEEIAPTSISTSPKGETIIDFGQNLVGVVRFKVSGEEGDVIKLEHAEVLDKDGTFGNFIDGFNRDQTDFYIVKGDFEEVWQPEFTFHGFRYVKVTGYPGEVKKENFKAIVIGSDCKITNQFETSDPRLNQLQSNIMWSQRGNLLSIPTDCPQRERAGWTGDVWVYGETCCINQDCLNFFKMWLKNLREEQFENGLVPIVIPYIKAYEALQLKSFGTHTSAGWGDVIVALPWYLYEIYGDKSVLEDNYEAMEKWMNYVAKEVEGGYVDDAMDGNWSRERQRYLWNTNFHFGDWLYPSCKTPAGEADMFQSANTTKEHVATAIYASSTAIMSDICQILGKSDRSQYYKMLNKEIRNAFEEEYVNDEGIINNDLQGLYVMALAMDLVTEELRPKLAERLKKLIDENGGCLDTGFMSIKFLMDVLVDNSLVESANTILYQEKCPSWLYEVDKGATTIWETWNSIHENDERGRFSYNHYAFGCIGDFMYRRLLGIRRMEPGYKKILIEPDFRFGLSYAAGKYQSAYGTVEVSWRCGEGKNPELYVKIPANVTGYIKLPGENTKEVGNGSFHFS